MGSSGHCPEPLRTPVIFCEAGSLNRDAQGAHSEATPCSQGHGGALWIGWRSPCRRAGATGSLEATLPLSLEATQSLLTVTPVATVLHERLLSPAPGVSEVSARRPKSRSFLLTGPGGGGQSSAGAWGRCRRVKAGVTEREAGHRAFYRGPGQSALGFPPRKPPG